jgi:hypothetical protein
MSCFIKELKFDTAKVLIFSLMVFMCIFLKDRPSKTFKETDLLLPRKCPFAFERHLCHQAMQIGYKTPLPTLTHGITGFRVPLHSPMCSFFSSVLYR